LLPGLEEDYFFDGIATILLICKLLATI